MCDKDLPPTHDLRERHRLVLLPLLHGLLAVDEDDKVLIGALEVHLGLGGVSARHDD